MIVFPNLPFPEPERIKNYVASNIRKWEAQPNAYFYLGKKETQSPFAVEGWRDEKNVLTVVVHTKLAVGEGGNKTVTFSFDQFGTQLVRIKPKLNAKAVMVKEKHLLQEFAGEDHIIQNIRVTDVMKPNGRRRIHFIQKKYSGDLLLLKKLASDQPFTARDIDRIAEDTLKGLNKIFEKGRIHGDISRANILFQMNEQREIVQAILTDLKSNNDKTTLLPCQILDLELLVMILTSLYEENGLPVPPFFSKMQGVLKVEKMNKISSLPSTLWLLTTDPQKHREE